MIDSIFEKRPKRHVKDLNIVPILDMLTTVIFFLLMSTGFMEYTKLTVPPSGTTTVSASGGPPPLTPKMFLGKNTDGSLELLLSWQGSKPGELRKKVGPTEGTGTNPELLSAGKDLAKEFVKENPSERTIQVGLEPEVAYQNLVTLMDGIRESLPDVVLISYDEVRALREGLSAEDGSQ